MGLGSCIIGLARAAFMGDQADEMSRLVGFPESSAFMISIAIGRAATTTDPHVQHPEKVTVLR